MGEFSKWDDKLLLRGRWGNRHHGYRHAEKLQNFIATSKHIQATCSLWIWASHRGAASTHNTRQSCSDYRHTLVAALWEWARFRHGNQYRNTEGSTGLWASEVMLGNNTNRFIVTSFGCFAVQNNSLDLQQLNLRCWTSMCVISR